MQTVSAREIGFSISYEYKNKKKNLRFGMEAGKIYFRGYFPNSKDSKVKNQI